jgi:hypothetical protein
VVALGIAITPLLACVAVGVTVVYGRRLRVGDFADFGGRSGQVRAITLLEVRLEDPRGNEVRVPHLLGLVHPTRVLGPLPLVTALLTLASSTARQDDVRELLLEAAAAVGERSEVELCSFDADGAATSRRARGTRRKKPPLRDARRNPPRCGRAPWRVRAPVGDPTP